MGRHPGLLLRDMGILSATVTTVWTAITEGIGGLMQGIWDTITSIWQSIYDTISPLLEAFRYLFETIFEAIKILIGRALDAISSKVTEIWNGIVSFLRPLRRQLDIIIMSSSIHADAVLRSAWLRESSGIHGGNVLPLGPADQRR